MKEQKDCIKELIADEYEAIDGYVAAKKVFKDNAEAKKLFDTIKLEEEKHIKMLEEFAKKLTKFTLEEK